MDEIFFSFFFLHSSLSIYPHPSFFFLIPFFIIVATNNNAPPYSTKPHSRCSQTPIPRSLTNTIIPHTQNRDRNKKNHKFESNHKNQRHQEICTSKSSLPSMDTTMMVLYFDSISEICFSFLDPKLLVLEF